MLSGNQSFAYAFFEDEATAAAAVRSLLSADFASEHIGALMLDESGVSELPMKHKTGIAPGTILGALLGTAVGLTLPGLGLVALGGAFTLAEAAAAGGVTGAFAGILGGMGIWRDEYDFPSDAFARGGVLVGVLTSAGRAPAATEALRRAGAGETSVATRDDAEHALLERGYHHTPRS